MQYSRSQRRHHRARLIVKRRKEDARYGTLAANETEWRFKNCRIRARTGCVCSCAMCGNPRRRYGNSLAALTRQELRVWKIADLW